MYLAAVIQLSNGEQKTIEAESKFGPFCIPKFMTKLRKYAKQENKLVKIVADDFKIINFFSEQLPHVKVEYGIKECPDGSG